MATDKIKIKKGLKQNLPVLEAGELAHCYDTNELYIGSYEGNKKINSSDLFVNVKDFGAKGDGTTDDTQAIQNAIDTMTDGGILFFPQGTYNILGDLNLKSNVHYLGTPNTTLDFSNKTTYSNDYFNPLIKADGNITSEISLTSDGIKGNYTLQCDTTNLNPGDLVIVTSDYQWLGDASPHEHGEMNIIEAINSSTEIKVTDALHEDYTVLNNAKIQVINPIENIIFENMNIKGKGVDPNGTTGDYGLMFKFGRNIDVKNCNFYDINMTCLDFMSVYNFSASKNTFELKQNIGTTVLQYGIKYSNASIWGTIKNNTVINGKHGILSGHTYTYPGIQRNILIQENNISGTWHGGIVTHNSTELITIDSNKISGCEYGINTRVSDIIISNNTFKHCNSGVYLSDMPYRTKITNNIFIKSSFTINDTALEGNFNVEYIEITNNLFVDAMIGIDVTNNTEIKRGWKIQNNTIKNPPGNALNLYGKIRAIISGNEIIKIAGRGIYLSDVMYSSVQNNIIEDTTSASIQITGGADWNTIANNVLLDHDYGTAVYDDSTGTNNTIRDNTDNGSVAI